MYDKDLSVIDFPKGVTPLDIFISSIQKERELEEMEGKSGSIDYGFVYKEREIELKLLLKANDTQDYRLIRDETYDVLERMYYVSEEYQPGKVYHVHVDESYIPERYAENNQTHAEVEVECVMPDLPFAESIGTTQQIDEDGLLYSDDLWQYGMGLEYEKEAQKYTHRRLEFAIYNAGNVPIHPFDQKLTIMLRNIGKGYTLINETTGDKFEYTGRVTGDFKLDGANMTMKGLQSFRDTNRNYISLAPGWNHFNQNKAKITEWDFKFYYK